MSNVSSLIKCFETKSIQHINSIPVIKHLSKTTQTKHPLVQTQVKIDEQENSKSHSKKEKIQKVGIKLVGLSSYRT
uniref:Uncharacterized protein n=1 Tax=viral metagenome TaxID=1070528 RepID=A0A6C0DZ09_9ZZZZ